MHFEEFRQHGFYFHNGSELVRPGLVLYGPDHNYYQVYHEERTSHADYGSVYLKQAGRPEVHLEPDHDFLEACILPPDPTHIPSFE